MKVCIEANKNNINNKNRLSFSRKSQSIKLSYIHPKNLEFNDSQRHSNTEELTIQEYKGNKRIPTFTQRGENRNFSSDKGFSLSSNSLSQSQRSKQSMDYLEIKEYKYNRQVSNGMSLNGSKASSFQRYSREYQQEQLKKGLNIVKSIIAESNLINEDDLLEWISIDSQDDTGTPHHREKVNKRNQDLETSRKRYIEIKRINLETQKNDSFDLDRSLDNLNNLNNDDYNPLDIAFCDDGEVNSNKNPDDWKNRKFSNQNQNGYINSNTSIANRQLEMRYILKQPKKMRKRQEKMIARRQMKGRRSGVRRSKTIEHYNASKKKKKKGHLNRGKIKPLKSILKTPSFASYSHLGPRGAKKGLAFASNRYIIDDEAAAGFHGSSLSKSKSKKNVTFNKKKIVYKFKKKATRMKSLKRKKSLNKLVL